MADDKLIVHIATEHTQENVFKTTSPVHSSLYPRNIKFYVNTELSNPCPTRVVQKRIVQMGKVPFQCTITVSALYQKHSKTIQPSQHPNKHLETSLQDTRLRKTKLTVHTLLNVANMKKYSQKEYRHPGVSHYQHRMLRLTVNTLGFASCIRCLGQVNT